jgi:hypothetical protein
MAQNLVLSIDSVISLLSGLPLFFFPQIVADSVLVSSEYNIFPPNMQKSA